MSYKLKKKIDAILKKERGTIYKEHGGKITVALVYPNKYNVGMSNLGYQGIYGILNNIPDVVCERVFLPDETDIKEYIRTNTELFSLESKKPINRFNIVAFSIPFENDYPNIIKILNLSKIPIKNTERDLYQPLLIVGGVCLFFNPEPIADFFDICFIGEAEDMLIEFLNIYRKSSNKAELLSNSVGIDGIYIPSFYNIEYGKNGLILSRNKKQNAPEIIKRRIFSDLSKSPITTSIITPETEFSEMYLIEAMRGCPWNCRFCVTNTIYKPVREKPLENIKKEIKSALSKTKRVGIIAPSLSDYRYSTEILNIPGVDFSITSLRVGTKSNKLIKSLKKHKSISIAPEAGTERLRFTINKKIKEQDIIDTTEILLKEGIDNLRLYFMIGLPTETEKDIEGIINLTKKIRSLSEKGNIVLSISTFIPKPFTPFQWHYMENYKTIKYRLNTIKKTLANIRGIKVFHDMPKYAYMQALFSLGDRRISGVIETMGKTESWQRACQMVNINPDFYIFRKRGYDEILPWDFIDIGIPKARLWEEYQKALSSYEE